MYPTATIPEEGLETEKLGLVWGAMLSCRTTDAPRERALADQAELMAAIAKYSSACALVDASKHDADGSSLLDRVELELIMCAVAQDPDQMREALGLAQTPFAGIPINLGDDEIDEAISLVIAEAEWHDGVCKCEESVAAIGIWLRYVYQLQREEWMRRIKQKSMRRRQLQKSSSCVLS